MSVKRNVFTIAPGAPFLEAFVNALLAGKVVPTISRASPPLEMARTTIYVPTQRAGRALAAQFAHAFDKGATLLPRILPLGGLEERESSLLFGDLPEDFEVDVPPPIEELDRRLLLAELVAVWSKAVGQAIVSTEAVGDVASAPFLVASSPAGAYALAADLGALIDEFIIEGVEGAAIEKIVDEEFDRYWSITTRFLEIAFQQWPEMLRERGAMDAAARGKLLLEMQTASLARAADHAPVIALGSTGAQPATARLLSTIAALDKGAVVLPGLDCEMSEDAWTGIGASEGEPTFTHPQAMLKRLLGAMRLERADVRELGELPQKLGYRRTLVSQALAPAQATNAWREFRAARSPHFASALEDVAVLEAPDERMEALTLALYMREALETPGRTAALVTPDRNIARRVAAELARFEIEIDDSGGASLASTAAGALARQIATLGADGLDAVGVAALLAHPLARFARSRDVVESLSPLLEIGVLRALPASAGGYAEVVVAARAAAENAHAHPAARRITEAQWVEIESLLRDIESAFESFRAPRGDNLLKHFAQAHRTAFEAVTRGAEEGDDASAPALFDLFDRLANSEARLDFEASSYAALFDRIAFETILRGPRRAHPRLKILGPLEARLIEADLVLLAGLDDGVWPPQTDTGAFLNRSMRRQLGFSPPERRIGQSAHDFMMALGAKSVVLGRALKRDGSPTVASRFLTRLEALAGEAFVACKARGKHMLAIAAALDHMEPCPPLKRPDPRPSVELRPKRLSVTRIETLRRDPYAIFAEYILKLKPLAPLGVEIGAREMGTAIHAALEKFVSLCPHGPLPKDARQKLHDIARDELREFFADAAFVTFTWPRLVTGLDHAISFEHERRAAGAKIFMEAAGTWNISLDDGSVFSLTAKADRIEIDLEGNAYVFDYKTGAPPSRSQVEVGWSPQLTLEAAMIEAGAFPKIGAHPVIDGAYVGLKGDGKTLWITSRTQTFPELVAKHSEELRAMLLQFRDVGTPYPSRPYVALVARAGDYDHLARVKEWSRGGGDGA